MLKLLIRYIKFLGTSVVGTIVETLVLWLFSDHVFTKGYWGEYVISPLIAFQCSIAVNFAISYMYVWKDRKTEIVNARTRRIVRQFAVYNLSGLAVFIFRLGLLLIVEKFTGWDVVICNLAAMCISGIINFIISNYVVFRK